MIGFFLFFEKLLGWVTKKSVLSVEYTTKLKFKNFYTGKS